ncbi:Putative TEGT family carrier/transport protein [hydrothermal vent metagenome]|uniref:Putative TEGT family carrier/transport protein n=1 Tax=hydrothermal vent metagenome TaxID=652676 RepID=A0A1W1C1E3_9ZZZZ
MNTINRTIARPIIVNKTLRSTYQLLSATLIFSGLMAFLAMQLKLPSFGFLITLGGYFGLLYLTTKFRNSAWGILAVFALTGFMGLTLGPIINAYVSYFANGTQLVAMAMTSTGIIFLSLSFYAIVSQKNFSFLSGFLMSGILIAFIASLANIFFQVPALSLIISSAFVLLMSALILYETSNIIHGGETNYIMATVSLFVAIYNLFLSLLQILGIFSGDE